MQIIPLTVQGDFFIGQGVFTKILILFLVLCGFLTRKNMNFGTILPFKHCVQSDTNNLA